MREKLLPLAKQFFGINTDIKKIYITEDRHCWYSEIEAVRFCGGLKKYECFTPDDLKRNQSPKNVEVKKEESKSKSKAKPKK